MNGLTKSYRATARTSERLRSRISLVGTARLKGANARQPTKPRSGFGGWHGGSGLGTARLKESNNKQQVTQGNSFCKLFPFFTPTVEKEGVF